MDVDPLSSWRADARAWWSARRFELLILAGIWVLAAVVYFIAAQRVVTPRHQQDEFLYWALAKSLAAGDGLSWRGEGVALRSFFYPLSIAPVFEIAGGVQARFDLVHAFNAAMMTAVVFPAFLMARLLVDRKRALGAAAFTVLVPAMTYVGLIGTETLAYPLATAAFGAILLSCAEPRARNTLLALGLIGLTCFARLQLVVLLPIWVGAVFVVAAMRAPGERVAYLRQQRAVLGVVAGLALVAVLFVLAARDKTVGLYVGVFDAVPLTWQNLTFWGKSFLADVFLVTAIVPAIATFALIGARENRRDPRLAALIALAYVAALGLVAQVVWFSATSPEYWRIQNLFYERYIFYIGPIFFAGFFAAFDRVSTRAAIVTSVIAVVIVSGFQNETLALPFSYEAFGLTFLSHIVSGSEGSAMNVGRLAAGIAIVLAAAYVCSTLPERYEVVRRYGRILAVALPLVALIATQSRAWSYTWLYADDAKGLQPKPADFIDRAGEEDVGMIVAKGIERVDYFQDEFWNTSVKEMWVSPQAPVSSPKLFTPMCRFGWSEDGRISSRNCPEQPASWYLRSKRLTMYLRGETRRLHPTSKTMTLSTAPRPATIRSFLDGRDPSTGAVLPPLAVTTFLRQSGQLRFAFKATAPLTTSVAGRSIDLSGGDNVVTLRVEAGERVTRFALPRVVPGLRLGSVNVREGSGPWRPVS